MECQVSILESDVRFTNWPPYMECQVSILESDVRFTNWPPYMECQVSILGSDVRFSNWPPYIEWQVSSLESNVRFTYCPAYMQCQVSNLVSEVRLPTCLHIWNARCQALNLITSSCSFVTFYISFLVDNVWMIITCHFKTPLKCCDHRFSKCDERLLKYICDTIITDNK